MSTITACLNHSILRPLVHLCNSLPRGGGKKLIFTSIDSRSKIGNLELEGDIIKNSGRFLQFLLCAILACVIWTTTAMAATEQQRLDAINKGLANLYATRQLYQQQGYDWVYWSYGGYEPAATGAAVLAFMSQKDKWGSNATNYQAAIDRAMNYLLSVAATFTVGNPPAPPYVRDDGNNPCGNNSTCLGVYWPAANNEITYTTGLIAPTIAIYAAGHANDVATTSGPLAGLTWSQIAQGITNTFALSQSTASSGNRRGGWRYYPGEGDSDSSTTQWAIISMIYDETLGAATPQFVKDELKYWLAAVQSDPSLPGAVCYQPGLNNPSTNPCEQSDTGGWLLGMKFVGYDLSNSQVQAALGFLNNNWTQTANNTWYGNFGHPYAMWSVYKGLEATIDLNDTTHITNLLTTCGAPSNLPGNPPGSIPCNWWEDYNQWLVDNQNPDGSWTGTAYWVGPLATAFDINILGATPIPGPPPAALCGQTLKTQCSYGFSLELGTQETQFIQLINPGTVSRSATLEVVNPHSGLTVSLTQPNPITLAPGETKTLSINLDPGTTPVGVYDDLLLKVTADDGSTLYSSIKVYVVPPGAGQLPDLAISAKDIHSTTNADGTVTLTADIHNQGTASASNVQVQFYEFGNLLGTTALAQMPPNGIGSASITVPAMTAGDHLIRVVIDPAGAIQELDKTNNEASQIVRIGSPSPTTEGNILVTGSLPSTVYAGSLFTLTGQAVYAINVNGTTNTDYVVKGGAVQITVSADGGANWVYGDVHTDVNGNFSKSLQAPTAPGTYHISMIVTDQTFSGTRELVFNVIEAPAPGSPPPSPPPPPTSPGNGTGNWTFDPAGGPSGTWTWTWTTPPTTPIPDSDLRVFSENIHFSKNNPAANEEITLFAEIQYWASSTALVAHNVPVNLYVTPVTVPATPRMKIGQTVIASLSVGSPDFGSRYVYATWKNPGQGIYIVEVEIDPSYVEAYMLNNAATRAIIVGQSPDGLGVISGQVTNPLSGMGNVMIHVRNASGTEIGNAITDQTGSYLVKAVPLGATLQVHIDTPTGYLVVAPDTETQTVTISNNEPVGTVNFHLAKPTGDTTPPILSLPAAIITEATGSSGAVVTYTASATDAVDGAVTPTCAPASGSTFPLGTTTVNCTATDKAGNTARGSFTITVRDTTPPMLVCPHNINIVQGQPLDLGTPTVSDAVDTAPMLSNNAPASFPIGTTAVTWTATDKAGNQASCVQQVTIVAAPANQPPIANAGPDRTVRQGSLVTLNGSGFDPDNGPSPLTFSWSQTEGSSVTLNGASTANPTFTPSTKGTYVFSLVVNDGADKSAPSAVRITVPLLCDIDLDGDVDRNDISLITAARNQPAVPNDIRDYDGDGTITVNDARACVLKCTRSNCATQ
jgi:hypothetical protein